MEELDRLGSRKKKLDIELDEMKPKLHEAMRAARAAGATQREVMERSGYKTIQQVRVILGEVKSPQEDLEANPELVEQMERTAADPSSRAKRGRLQKHE